MSITSSVQVVASSGMHQLLPKVKGKGHPSRTRVVVVLSLVSGIVTVIFREGLLLRSAAIPAALSEAGIMPLPTPARSLPPVPPPPLRLGLGPTEAHAAPHRKAPPANVPVPPRPVAVAYTTPINSLSPEQIEKFQIRIARRTRFFSCSTRTTRKRHLRSRV